MRRVLTFRTDAIGDAILWAGATQALRQAFPAARHAVVCRHASAPIFETCPFIDDVIAVDPRSIAGDESARDEAIRRLNEWGPDIVLNPLRSRERISESLVRVLQAPVKIALESDTANASHKERTEFDAAYTRVVPSPAPGVHELERHADFLSALGVTPPALWPSVWLTTSDRTRAHRFFDDLGVVSQRTMAVFPAARWRYKVFPAWPQVLSGVLTDQEDIDTVLVMGDQDATESVAPIAAAIAQSAPQIRVFERCGNTALREAIATIERCRICVGNDTFAIHAASALGVPSVALVGGGHFGRFLPYDPNSTVACRPLSCYACDWRCSYDHAHCIHDVPDNVAIAAIRASLARSSDRPRIFVPAADTGIESGPDVGAIPAWVRAKADIIEVPVSTQGTRRTNLLGLGRSPAAASAPVARSSHARAELP